MGRWVRWFGEENSTHTATASVPFSSEEVAGGGAKVLTMSSDEVRRALVSPSSGRLPASPAPTGMLSVAKMGAEMLTSILVTEGAITATHEAAALNEHRATGRAVELILIEAKYISEEDFLSSLSHKCKLPHIDLERRQFKEDIVELVSVEFARANNLLPLDKLGKMLTVATSNPLDVSALKRLETEVELKVKPMLVSPVELKDAIDMLYPAPDAQEDDDLASAISMNTVELFRDSWMSLIGKTGVIKDDSKPKDDSEQPIAEDAPLMPIAEEAIMLADDDPRVLGNRSGVDGVYRSWGDSLGIFAVQTLTAEKLTNLEFELLASKEPRAQAEPTEEPTPEETSSEEAALEQDTPAEEEAPAKPKKSKRAKAAKKKTAKTSTKKKKKKKKKSK